MAGLAAATRLAGRPDLRVTLHEATAKAGGRCRSYRDAVLDRVIDNGNHLVLSGNRAVLAYAARIGSASKLEELPEAAFPFVDLENGNRWTMKVPRSPLGSLAPGARPPGASLADLAGALGVLAAGPDATVADAVRGRGPMWRAFWEPLTLAVLNAPPQEASAALMRAVLARSFLRGSAFSRPVVAPEGLGAALVEPALGLLEGAGAQTRFRAPLTSIRFKDGSAVQLDFQDGSVTVASGDAVILALPPAALAQILPDLPLPGSGRAILNAHFRLPPELAQRCAPLTGVLGGAAHWIFRRGDVLSVTVSAADAFPIWSMPKEDATALLWSDVCRSCALPQTPPLAARLLRERAATFDQSPAGAARRPAARFGPRNVFLAGDHVATGLPATLEGAIRSGENAARAVLDAA